MNEEKYDINDVLFSENLEILDQYRDVSLSTLVPEKITAVNAAQIYKKVKLVEKALELIKKKITDICMTEEVPGLKLVHQERKRFNDNKILELYNELKDIVDINEFLACCSVNLKNMEFLIGIKKKEIDWNKYTTTTASCYIKEEK